jgi:hypothetical protein
MPSVRNLWTQTPASAPLLKLFGRQSGNKTTGQVVSQSKEEQMNNRKSFLTLGSLLALVVLLPSARAAQYDQATKLSFSRQVQIPGRVLPAGTYWFVLADSLGSRNTVEIFNSDRSKLYATVFTNTVETPTASNETTITFAERERMEPVTILSWFYPGRSFGHQFVYSDVEKQQLAQAKQRTEMVKAQSKRQTAMAGD